jgi:hypothetical protein
VTGRLSADQRRERRIVLARHHRRDPLTLALSPAGQGENRSGLRGFLPRPAGERVAEGRVRGLPAGEAPPGAVRARGCSPRTVERRPSEWGIRSVPRGCKIKLSSAQPRPPGGLNDRDRVRRAHGEHGLDRLVRGSQVQSTASFGEEARSQNQDVRHATRHRAGPAGPEPNENDRIQRHRSAGAGPAPPAELASRRDSSRTQARPLHDQAEGRPEACTTNQTKGLLRSSDHRAGLCLSTPPSEAKIKLRPTPIL